MLFVDGVAIEERPKLYLNGRGIRSFEGKSSVVKRLALSDNHLTSFVAEKGAFPNLTELYLTGNQLTSFIAEEGAFPRLKVLDLSRNKLTSFITEKGAFPRLEALYLNGNQLTSFIAEEGAFPNLEVLYLYDNPNLETLKISVPILNAFWLENTKIRFLDASLVEKVKDREDIQVHYHSFGTKHVVTESQHQGNPIISEMIEHLTR